VQQERFSIIVDEDPDLALQLGCFWVFAAKISGWWFGTLPSGKFTRITGTGESTMWWFIPLLVGGLEHDFYDFPIILGMSSSQLTNSLHDFSVRGRYKVETTNQIYGDFEASKYGGVN